MKILLTGATGFIGGHFLEYLSKEHEVTALVRRSSDVDRVKNMGASLVVFADLLDPDLVSKLPDGIDLVCHCAGILGQWNVPFSVYRRVHVEGTDRLLQACRSKKIQRMIHLSSAGVLGAVPGEPGNEHSAYHPGNDYERAKAEAEQHALAFCREHAMKLTVFRPEFVYGERDLHVLSLFKAIRERKFALIDGGRSLLHPTYIGDLVQALDLVMNTQDPSEIYMVSGERALPVREFAGIISRISGVPASERSLPLWGLKPAARVLEALGRVFHFDPVLTRSRLDFFTSSRNYSSQKISSGLGYKPISLEEGLRRTIQWYREHGYFPE